MNTITKELFIPKNHRPHLELELPPNCPTGEVTVTVIVEPKTGCGRHHNRAADIRGIYKGIVRMADDFDDPLDDFREYR